MALKMIVIIYGACHDLKRVIQRVTGGFGEIYYLSPQKHRSDFR